MLSTAIHAPDAEAVTAGAKDRDQIWLMISDERARVLEAMKVKFGPTFESATAK